MDFSSSFEWKVKYRVFEVSVLARTFIQIRRPFALLARASLSRLFVFSIDETSTDSTWRYVKLCKRFSRNCRNALNGNFRRASCLRETTMRYILRRHAKARSDSRFPVVREFTRKSREIIYSLESETTWSIGVIFNGSHRNHYPVPRIRSTTFSSNTIRNSEPPSPYLFHLIRRVTRSGILSPSEISMNFTQSDCAMRQRYVSLKNSDIETRAQ